MDRNLHELSAEACFIADGCFTFAAGALDDIKEGVPIPVQLKARSRGPADHWCYYGGRVYHDFAGMIVHKPRLGFDYEHHHLIGFCENHRVTDFGLELDGAFVPDGTADDWAVTIPRRAAGGTPYELSINTYGPMSVEIVDDGFEAQVNGETVFGPCAIVRKWHLRGVAVCSYGTDMYASAKFNAGDKVRVEFISAGEAEPASRVATGSQGHVVTPRADGAFMSTPATTPAAPAAEATTTTTTPATPPVETPATPAAAPAATTPTPEATPAAPPATGPAADPPAVPAATFSAADLAKYSQQFSAERGVLYLTSGVTFAAAQAIDAHFAAAIKQRDEEIQQLRTKLSGAVGAAAEGAGLGDADADKFGAAPGAGGGAKPKGMISNFKAL